MRVESELFFPLKLMKRRGPDKAQILAVEGVGVVSKDNYNRDLSSFPFKSLIYGVELVQTWAVTLKGSNNFKSLP